MFLLDVSFVTQDSQDIKSDSSVEDNKVAYIGIGIAGAIVVALAVTIAVLHIQSIPKSDKNKQRYLDFSQLNVFTYSSTE